MNDETETPEQHAERVTSHFETQTDLFTQCRYCDAHLTGSLSEIASHQCEGLTIARARELDIADLLGV